MKLTLICEHGTRTVEGEINYDYASLQANLAAARDFIAEATPRCPYCDIAWSPRYEVQLPPKEAA